MLDTLRENVYPGELAADVLESIRARPPGKKARAPLPGAEPLRAMLDAAFRASLLPEEGRFPTFAMAFMPDEAALGKKYVGSRFKSPLRLDPAELAKMAPGVDADTTFIAATVSDAGVPVIWGLVLACHPREATAVKGIDPETIADPFLVIRVRRPGVFYVYYAHRLELLYARGVAIPPFNTGGVPRPFQGGAGLLNPASPADHALAQVVSRVGLLGHGGTILVTDPDVPAPPLLEHTYVFTPPSRALADAIGLGLPPQVTEDAIDLVAGLARMDGAVHITSDLMVQGFGVKIRMMDPGQHNSFVSEDPITRQEREVAFTDLTGMRHRSAALFCAHQSGRALALVVSQDGDVTLFGRQDDGRVRRIGPFVLGAGVLVA